MNVYDYMIVCLFFRAARGWFRRSSVISLRRRRSTERKTVRRRQAKHISVNLVTKTAIYIMDGVLLQLMLRL